MILGLIAFIVGGFPAAHAAEEKLSGLRDDVYYRLVRDEVDFGTWEPEFKYFSEEVDRSEPSYGRPRVIRRFIRADGTGTDPIKGELTGQELKRLAHQYGAVKVAYSIRIRQTVQCRDRINGPKKLYGFNPIGFVANPFLWKDCNSHAWVSIGEQSLSEFEQTLLGNERVSLKDSKNGTGARAVIHTARESKEARQERIRRATEQMIGTAIDLGGRLVLGVEGLTGSKLKQAFTGSRTNRKETEASSSTTGYDSTTGAASGN